MAVSLLDAFADTGATDDVAPGSFTVSAGTDRVLFYIQHYEGLTDNITAVSYGGEAMTELVSADRNAGNGMEVRIWALNDAGIAAAVGTDFSVTGTANGTYRATAGSVEGADQTLTPTDTAILEDGLDGSSTPIDTVADGLVLATGATANLVDIAWTGITERFELDSGQTASTAFDTTASAATIDLDITVTGSGGGGQAMAAVALGPAVATGVDLSGQSQAVSGSLADLSFRPDLSGQAQAVSSAQADMTDPPETTIGLDLGDRRVFVTKDGNDSNDGLSRANAKLTIQAALNIAQARDVISIGGGDYFETPSVSNLTGPIWIVAERRGTVLVSHYKQDAFEGTLVWTDEGGGTYSTPHSDAWSGSHDGDFLFRYQSQADLEAATITVSGIQGTNVIAKPDYGLAIEGGDLYIRLRGGVDPTGKQVKITDSFSQVIFDFNNCDNIILDGINVEGAGDTPAIDFDASSANPTVRNCKADHSRGLCRVSSGFLLEWNEYTYEGFGTWMRDLVALDGIENLGIFDINKNYNSTSGNTHYEGGIAFGTSSVDTGGEIRFCWVHDVFEGMRAGEHDNQKIHDNVIENVGDNPVEFESFRSSDLSANIEFFDNLVLNAHDSFTSHQFPGGSSATGPQYIYRNVFEADDPSLARPRWVIKMINTGNASNLGTIAYYHNYFKLDEAFSKLGNPDDFTGLWADDFSSYQGDEIDVLQNNVAIYSGGMNSGNGPNPNGIASNILAAPFDNTVYQSGGGSREADEAALLLGSNRQLLSGSPLIGAATALPGGLPDSTGRSQADVGPFPDGFDPGADWPRVRITTFSNTTPEAFSPLTGTSAATSGSSANLAIPILVSGSSDAISGSSSALAIASNLSGTVAATSSAGPANLIFLEPAVANAVSGSTANPILFSGSQAIANAVSGSTANPALPIPVAPPILVEDSFRVAQRPVILVDLFFDSGEVNIWTRPFESLARGKTYRPLAGVTSGVTIQNSLDSNLFEASIQISGQSQEILSIALTENYRNRRADIFLGNIGADGTLEAFENVFPGFIVNMPITDNETESLVSVVVESVFKTASRPETFRLSPADLELSSPDDSFLDFTETTGVLEPRFGG